MRNWNEYFENKETSVNEHHMHTKEDQISWICEVLPKLSKEQVKEIYDLIEDKLDVE
ncbi:MAG: hypothetical protein ACOCVF_03725 [bacterium]